MKIEPCCKSVEVRKGMVAQDVTEEGVYEFLDTTLPKYLLVIATGRLFSRLVYSPELNNIQVLDGLSTYEVVKTNKKLCMELKD